MVPLLVATAHLLGIVSAVDAVMNTRTAQGAAAWAIFLVTFPYLALPIYWMFGRDRFDAYAEIRAGTDRELRGEAARLAAWVEASEVEAQRSDLLPLGSSARKLAGVPYLAGNDVELLVDGDATFDSILAGIARATDYVLVQFYIVRDDGLGARFRDALVERVRAGVRFYFLYDEVGSYGLPRPWLAALRSDGVEVSAFNSLRGPDSRFRINFRNHRKLVVVDGRDAWIGGHNVGDEYLGLDPDVGPWRDTHLRVSGPAVGPFQFAFLQDWHWATDGLLGLEWAPPERRGDAEVLALASGPADPFETVSLAYTGLIDAAEERVWVASPYFVPDGAVAKALQMAALRGVDVRVLIPDGRDHWSTWLAAFAYQARVAPSGVFFRRYMEGFMHQKVVLIDDRVATVGTANFDNRSFRLNFELTAVVADPDFVLAVASMLEDDFTASEPMPEDALARRPFWFRLAVNLARLTAPVQ